MSSFAFLPRSIGRQKINAQGGHNSHGSLGRQGPVNLAGPSGVSSGDAAATVQTSKSALQNEDDLLTMLELSLSDYAVWCTPELQYLIRSGEEGYIPLKYLLENSPAFSSKEPTVSEVFLVQRLRSSTTSIIEARMFITEPSRNEWASRSQGHIVSKRNRFLAGGFEVRRKDWKCILDDLDKGKWTKEWWDQRTVYIERLPAAFRSIPTVSRYVTSLLTRQDGGGASSNASKCLVQSVAFPPHHLASPKEVPRCKGFAFVVFNSTEHAEKISRDYSWKATLPGPDLDQDAVKFGLRVLSNASWNNLKSEYLSYQQHLLSKAAEEAAASEPSVAQNQQCGHPPKDQRTSISPELEEQPNWYPRNCLVFVRNIHPGTNKTTLRNLFQGALSTSKGSIDYVDFNKGVDSCHLRLTSPSDTLQLVSHFESQSISQGDPLDQVGSEPTQGRLRIEMEMVQGKREELYWEKVPEKLRDAALKRLTGMSNDGTVETGNRGKRRRKNT